MKKLLLATFIVVGTVGLLSADHHETQYEGIASVHDLMEDIVKPNMDRLAAMRKAGGPQNAKEWKRAYRAASVLAEGAQLTLLGGRVKDQVWSDGAHQALSAARDVMAAAKAQDMDAWMAGVGAASKGCRICHKAHKPKKE